MTTLDKRKRALCVAYALTSLYAVLQDSKTVHATYSAYLTPLTRVVTQAAALSVTQRRQPLWSGKERFAQRTANTRQA